MKVSRLSLYPVSIYIMVGKLMQYRIMQYIIISELVKMTTYHVFLAVAVFIT